MILAAAIGRLRTVRPRLALGGRHRLDRALAATAVGTAIVADDGRCLHVNSIFANRLGHAPRDLLKRPIAVVWHPADVESSLAGLRQARDQGRSQRFVKRCLHRSGAAIETMLDVIYVNEGGERYFVVFAQEMDAAARLTGERSRCHGLVGELGRIALTADTDQVTRLAVDRVRAVLSADSASIVLATAGEGFGRLSHTAGWAAADPTAPVLLQGPGTVTIEDRSCAPDHVLDAVPAPPDAHSSVSAQIAGPDRVRGALAVHSAQPRQFTDDEVALLNGVADVLAGALHREEAGSRLRHQAEHDALTGLVNRSYVLDRLSHAANHRRGDAPGLAVIVIDIDDFSMINDSLGHEVGDGLILAIAARLTGAVRSQDTVARVGGDQFVVLCEQLDVAATAVATAERMVEAARGVEGPGGADGLTVGAGVAYAERPVVEPQGLLRDAVAAMHRAKRRGRGEIEVFDPSIRLQAMSRMRFESELRLALRRGEITPHFQPIVDTVTGRPLAFEALARWQPGGAAAISPARFIPVAEAAGLIGDLGEQILDAASRQVASWQREREDGAGALELYVNVSGLQLSDPSFPARAVELATAAGLAPGTLGLEITETVLMEDADAVMRRLEELRSLGVRLLLDDFGTGYSSLAYLKRLPLDVVKIDRSFIAGLGTQVADNAIVEAVVGLSHALRLTTIAEGVEAEAQVEHLRRLGCPSAQGYHFARPVSAETLEAELLERWYPAQRGIRT